MHGVLTENEIWEYIRRPLDKDPLFISPLLDPKQVNDTTIDLRLGQYFLIQKPSRLSVLDVYEMARRRYGRYFIDDGYDMVRVQYGDFFALHTDQVVRVGTLEYIGMPRNLQGDVTLRHSVSSIPIMADIAKIQPGFRGSVILSLRNNSLKPVLLYPGLRIAQLELRLLSNKIQSPKLSRYYISVVPKPVRLHEDEEIRYLGPFVDPLILGIVSTISAGRSTALNYLSKKYGFIIFSLGTHLKEVAHENGISFERSKLQELGNKLRGLYGNGYLAEQLRSSRHWIENKHQLVIVDAFKHSVEVEEFKKQGRFYLVGIDAPAERRRDWDKLRQEIGARNDRELFDRVEQVDRGLSKDSRSCWQEVDTVMKMANEIIINDGSKENLYHKLDDMVMRAKAHITKSME